MQILIGPGQCGKSSLLRHIGKDRYKEITFDDLQMRNMADSDPAFFISQQNLPLIIDEAQYAPNIFPELKKIVDNLKKENLTGKKSQTKPLFRLTGSNQILIDKRVRETLAGRAEYYYLNTLTVSEILKAFPSMQPHDILLKGGWPEIYTEPEINPVRFLNNYIRNYIEKDIVLSSGISKQKEFNTVLGMLVARTGEFLNYSAIAGAAGVKSVTIKEWISIIERTGLVCLPGAAEKNLNKRLIKTPKIYFLDTGLAARLQGWTELQPLMLSPQAGHLFETLVFSEIYKFSTNSGKDLKISVWRTKEGEEIDFVIEGPDGKAAAFEAKMGIHSVRAEKLPPSFKKDYPEINELVIVSIGGEKKYLAQDCLQVPISGLTGYLWELF